MSNFKFDVIVLILTAVVFFIFPYGATFKLTTVVYSGWWVDFGLFTMMYFMIVGALNFAENLFKEIRKLFK